MFFRAIMNITEEFNRQKITEIKDKLIYDIEQINKGIYLNQTDSQIDYMNEIVICSDEIQSLRNKPTEKIARDVNGKLPRNNWENLRNNWNLANPNKEQLAPLDHNVNINLQVPNYSLLKTNYNEKHF